MNRKLIDRTNEWRKQQQILKEYQNKKLSTNTTSTSEDIDKKQNPTLGQS
jgi:hypothetical protein